ncbi:MAG: hypothetical protein LBQ01_07055, partial [Prevotellaceae bacterium]|nr:hypothetical protein [Prevotellaceae bacterium]
DTKGYGTRFGFQLRWEPRHNSYSHLAIADLYNDGIGEIVVAETGSGQVYALKPQLDSKGKIINLQKIWDTDILHKHPYTVGDFKDDDVHRFGSPVPYISDLNGDGIPDIIVYNKIYNGQTGDLELALEELNLFSDPRSDKNAYDACKNKAYVGRLTDAEQNDDCMPAVAINDIDGDGIMEIIAGSKIYKPLIVSPDTPSQNSFTVMHGPESVDVNGTKYYLTDGFTVVADIDGDDVQDVIVIKRHLDRKHFIIYVWDSRVSGNNGLKAFLAVQHDADQGHFSIPFVGDINGRADGKDGAKLPEICMTIARLANNGSYPVQNHPAANIPDYTSGANTGNDGTGMAFQGHVVAFTYDTDEKELSKRLKLSWILKHSDISHQTGIVMFDFDADGINELVYRDEFALRVLSPANRVNGFDFVNLAVTPKTNPDVVRFNERNISSYTGFECPVIADVNGDGSADIVTFGLESMSRIENSAGNLFVYEALGESWAPARPVWNQGIYYPLQINDDLKVPRRPQSTLTKYPSKLPAQKDTVILQPFNGNWIQQPVVRKSNYVPILMTSDPSIQMEQVKIVSSSAKQTVIRVTIDNRGKASANSQTPVSFYHTAIGSVNRILTTTFRRDIFPEGRDAFEYTLTGDFRDKIIYVRLVDNGTDVFPISSPIDCDPTNNTVSTMQVTAADDYYSLTRDGEVLLDVCANDTFSRKTDMHIEIVHSARHGQSIVSGTKISYTVDAGFEGIDTLRYRIRCSENNMTVKDEADVYILNLRPGAMEYLACPKANVHIDVKPVTNIAYLWYDSETGGKSLNGNKSANSITVTKKDQNEVVWVQPSAKGFAGTFPRFPVNLTVPDNCGKATPSECMTEGTLLFKEDFGGNSTSDANIAANSRFDGVITGYTHAATYAKNTYTVRKASGGKTEWFDNIYDHTYPGDKSRGYMMQFVVTQDRGQFYECRLNELCEGSTLNISAWIAGLSKNNTANNTGLAFVLEDSEGNALAKYYTGKIADSKPSWTNYGFSFTVPEKLSSLVLRIVNNSSNIRQFDAFVIDDIEIYLCTSKISITGDRDQGACVGAKHEFKVAFKDGGGTPAGSRIAYRWEFRHIDSARWRTLSEADTVVPAEVTHTIAIVSKTDEGYYRMRAGKSGDIDSQNCSAATDSVCLRVSKAFRFPDIRIQLSPRPKRTVRLTAYLDSISHTEIRWERLNLHTPAISAGTEPTTGSINTADFVTPGTYTYKYTATSQCGSSESKVYIRTLKDRIFNLPDTVMICRDREEDKLLNINQIFALELGGEWKYDASVNHDATVADNIVAIPQSSKYFGALMFDAANAWKTAPASYSKSYKGHDDAKIFKFVYTAPAGSNFPVKKEFVIVVVGDTMIKI